MQGWVKGMKDETTVDRGRKPNRAHYRGSLRVKINSIYINGIAMVG